MEHNSNSARPLQHHQKTMHGCAILFHGAIVEFHDNIGVTLSQKCIIKCQITYSLDGHKVFLDLEIPGYTIRKYAISMACPEYPISSCMKMSGVPLVLVHGGTVDQTHQPLHKIHDGVKLAAKTGYQTLLQTHCVLNAVEAAVNVLERDPTFNAGRGSAPNEEGSLEMGALIMEGAAMRAGSVALLKNSETPISVARQVMEQLQEDGFLAGDGALKFMQRVGAPIVSEDELKTPEMMESLNNCGSNRQGLGPMHGDTGGCVVVDWQGHVATGCSSGGRIGRAVGRVGTSPLPGCGAYCDDNIGAVACCGHGAAIMRYNLAHRILCGMRYGLSPEDSTIRELTCLRRKFCKAAGAITVSSRGDVGIAFTTENMAWACQQGHELHYGYYPGQHIVEILMPPC